MVDAEERTSLLRGTSSIEKLTYTRGAPANNDEKQNKEAFTRSDLSISVNVADGSVMVYPNGGVHEEAEIGHDSHESSDLLLTATADRSMKETTTT